MPITDLEAFWVFLLSPCIPFRMRLALVFARLAATLEALWVRVLADSKALRVCAPVLFVRLAVAALFLITR